jgi:predicted amidophosphoribosyltransferase
MYNHAHLLALEISKIIDKLLHYNVLVKSKWTKSQATLSRAERQKNLAGSIKLKSKEVIKDKKILLVDDVKTTGVTINKCCKILKNAGAQSIRVVTIATT